MKRITILKYGKYKTSYLEGNRVRLFRENANPDLLSLFWRPYWGVFCKKNSILLEERIFLCVKVSRRIRKHC